jgi:hypothetical protein
MVRAPATTCISQWVWIAHHKFAHEEAIIEAASGVVIDKRRRATRVGGTDVEPELRRV